MKYPLLFIFLFPLSLIAQEKLDHVWLFGDDTDVDSIEHFGGSVMDFNNDTLILYAHDREMPVKQTNASICDEEGNLLFYTNGVYIANAQHDTIENGGCCLSPGGLISISANRLPQGAIILPYPGRENEYLLVHMGERLVYAPTLDAGGGPVYYTHVDMNANDGAGLVVEKNIPILTDTLDYGKLTATRHANGRDWWITVPQFRSNLMYKMLFTPEGVEVSSQEVGEPIVNGLGQAVFAPDGSVYANVSLHGPLGCEFHIYRFDRCLGEFYEPLDVPFECAHLAAGVAVSPNSRFLYLLLNYEIYQIDLWSDDWEASMQLVAEYDGYEEPIPGFDSLTLATYFFLAQLAPDGKIYINTTNSVRSLHVINQPNQPGDSCDIQQHSVQLPTLNAFSLPNFPNYKLRNEVGSVCDTLGPVAQFSQQAEALSVQFVDESLKAPTAWHWDFGDGDTSILQNPLHIYEEDGVYEVCLRVSNLFGEDEYCEQSLVVTSSEMHDKKEIQLLVFPNPAREQLQVYLEGLSINVPVQFSLYSISGQLILTHHFLTSGQHMIDLKDLPAGMYWYRGEQNGLLVGQGKLVKQ